MNGEERALAQAAASLTVDDFRYLQEHRIIDVPAHTSNPNTQVTVTQEESPSEPRPKRKRRTIERDWPEVGTMLEADYEGVHYEAEVIAAPRYRSGRALKILSGPAAGTISHSMTGAMLKATEVQRQQNGLGRKDVANGWSFWKAREDTR
jgi:hypothetical protein